MGKVVWYVTRTESGRSLSTLGAPPIGLLKQIVGRIVEIKGNSKYFVFQQHKMQIISRIEFFNFFFGIINNFGTRLTL